MNTSIICSDGIVDLEAERYEVNIKAITEKVNANIDRVFKGKIRDIYGLRDAHIYHPSALSIRVWQDIERKYPGLRTLLLNHNVNICEP